MIAFVIVLLDSMMSYFLRPILGAKEVPVNAILPVVLLILLKNFGIKAFGISKHARIALIVGFTFFFLGIFFLPEFDLYRVATIATALSAFFIGYFAARWSDDAEIYAKAFLIIGGLYVCVCVLAIHSVFPSLFPVIKRVGYYFGIISVRPEITIDQNFQFFYIFPVVLVLALPFRLVRFIAGFVGLVCGFYVLNILQTRSGFLVMLGATVLCFLSPLFTKELGRKKTFILPFIILGLVLLNIELILQIGEPITERFFHRDYNTLEGRVMAIKYLFEHVTSPTWWFPHGNTHFKITVGGGSLPHSTPTAMFLEAGLPGLYMWIVIIFIPLINLTRMLLKSELDALATILLIGAIASFMGQLSLNAPLYEHIWLWAGAALGTLERLRHPFPDQEGIQRSGRAF
jgi:hypothetical protein